MNIIPIYRLGSRYTSLAYNSGKWVDGKFGKTLEEKLQEYLRVKHVILTNSGTSALLAAYWSLRNESRELTVDPYTFPATYQPAGMLGYKLNFRRFVLRPKLKTPDSSLCTLTHLYGQPNRLINLAAKRMLIEDACQAFGAEVKGEKVGTIGRIGCYSFYPTKLLHTCGHGGAVVTDDDNLYQDMKVFIESGRIGGKITPSVALNLRMDEIKAEFLIQELTRYGNRISLQRRIAHEFIGVISTPQPFLVENPKDRHIYSTFNLLMDRRDEFRKFMAKRAVETAVYYGDEVLPKEFRSKYLDITARIVSVPCRWNLTADEIKRIKTALKEWFA